MPRGRGLVRAPLAATAPASGHVALRGIYDYVVLPCLRTSLLRWMGGDAAFLPQSQ